MQVDGYSLDAQKAKMKASADYNDSFPWFFHILSLNNNTYGKQASEGICLPSDAWMGYSEKSGVSFRALTGI